MDAPETSEEAALRRASEELSSEEQERLVRRVTWRLIPLLFCCYIIAYIDRINVGFAKLQLQDALGVDPTVFNSVYGLGAGLFFVGYFLFEVPSNLILHKIGARVWIARIMVVWGIVSISFMFIKSVTSFYVLRFLLGAAEAGFFPGVILYITYWYPRTERARMIALFATGAIVAGVVGSPISGALLEMHGIGGLAGWQWLFLLEGLPAVVLGFVVLLLLPNRPDDARWLSGAEKRWINQRVTAGVAQRATGEGHTLRDCFASPLVWLFCLIYFLRNVATYGYEMWLPSMVKNVTGSSDAVVGFINGVPYLVAGIVMYMVGQHSDKTGERRHHIAVGAVAATVGFALAATAQNAVLAIGGLTLAFAGSKATLPPFWALSTEFLKGTASAGGIALINSVGNLGGLFGPWAMGLIKDQTGSNFGGLLLLGACYVGVGALAFAVPAKRSR